MLEILRGEGWDLKERELTKLRKDQNLLLREANKNGNGSEKRKRRNTDEGADENEDPDGDDLDQANTIAPPLDLAPEIIAKRQARQARLLAESEERLRKGTRRRRTKVWSGLPPDPEAPPRYPSELTMEENKKLLNLERPMYQQIRETFEEICRANGVVKKTSCGADTWKGVKDELIRRVPHLQDIFWGPDAAAVAQTRQPMALELICMDVTKKLRNVGARVTISEAKNFLALTPQEGRDIRANFDAILKADYFVSKLEVPREHWEGLKAQWIDGSPLLQQKLAGGLADPDYGMKLKCLESVACDVQKRHRDQQTRNDPTHLTKREKPITPVKTSSSSKSTTTNPRPASKPAAPPPPPPIDRSNAPFPPGKSMIPDSNHTQAQSPPQHFSQPTYSQAPENNSFANFASQALAASNNATQSQSSSEVGDLQIDPTLLEAASLPQQLQHESPYQHHYQNPNHYNNNLPIDVNSDPSAIQSNISISLPVYFRIAPTSSIKHLSTHPKVWLSTLNPPYTLGSLTFLALLKATANGHDARVAKIEGVAPGTNINDVGSRWSIDEDDELEAYLEMCGGSEGGGGGKVSFVVEIV